MCNGRLTLTVRTPEGARKHKGAYALVSVARHPVRPAPEREIGGLARAVGDLLPGQTSDVRGAIACVVRQDKAAGRVFPLCFPPGPLAPFRLATL